MDSAEYEQRVAMVVGKLRCGMPELEGPDIDAGSRNKIRGASGHRHQIDVSVSTPQRLLLVECKRWHAKVSLSAALVFYARIVDIGKAMDDQNKSIVAALASASGFTRGAAQFADGVAVARWHVQNEDEFVCRIMDVIGLGLRDNAGFSDSVRWELRRGGGPV